MVNGVLISVVTLVSFGLSSGLLEWLFSADRYSVLGNMCKCETFLIKS